MNYLKLAVTLLAAMATLGTVSPGEATAAPFPTGGPSAASPK